MWNNNERYCIILSCTVNGCKHLYCMYKWICSNILLKEDDDIGTNVFSYGPCPDVGCVEAYR